MLFHNKLIKTVQEYKMRLFIYPLILLLLYLGACGFQLRGAYLDKLGDARVFINQNRASTIANEVRAQLLQSGVTLAKSPADADYNINLSNERFDREVLSVSPVTGKVEEYEFILQVITNISGTDNSDVLFSETMGTRRDFAFDELAALSAFEEAEIIRGEMTKDTASQIIRSLVAITRSN